MCLKPRHPKFQPSSARGTFSNSGLNGGRIGEMYFFQRKKGYISETARDRAKVTIIRKWHIGF